MATLTIPQAQEQVFKIARQFNAMAERGSDPPVSSADAPPAAKVGALIQGVDSLLNGLVREGFEGTDVYAIAQALRYAAFLYMERINPEDAWFWTKEWQSGERSIDRQISAGQGRIFETQEAFDAFLDALDGNAHA